MGAARRQASLWLSFASRIDSCGVIALGVGVTRSDLEKRIGKWTF